MFVKIRLNVIRKLYYMIIMENKINNGRLFEKIIYTLFFVHLMTLYFAYQID